MCYVLYLGTDVDLPTAEFHSGATTFYLSESDGQIEVARQHFSKSRVYYAGSHTGCGCGFFFSEYGESEELAADQESSRNLGQAIEMALRSDSSVELFVAWSMSEGDPMVRRMEMTPEAILVGKEFPFREGDLIVFTASSTA